MNGFFRKWMKYNVGSITSWWNANPNVTQRTNTANCDRMSGKFPMPNNLPVIMLHIPTLLVHITIVVIFIRTSKMPSKNSLITVPLLPIVFKTDPNTMQNVTNPNVDGPWRYSKSLIISVLLNWLGVTL